MKNLVKKITGLAAAIPLAASLMVSTANADTIKIALAETPSDELAAFFVALDRAKANGLDYEWTAFSDEELAIQAVLSGQMDIALVLLTQRCNVRKRRSGLFSSFQS